MLSFKAYKSVKFLLNFISDYKSTYCKLVFLLFLGNIDSFSIIDLFSPGKLLLAGRLLALNLDTKIRLFSKDKY